MSRLADCCRRMVAAKPQAALVAWVLAGIVVCAAVAGGAARADADLEELEQRAIQAAVQRAAPAVVRIETVGGLERVSGVLFGTGPTSGVIVDPEGYIVSSAFNFINRPASILVRLPDGQRKPAELVATDRNYMLVLLKVQTDEPLPTTDVAPQDELRVGQWAVALGRTFEADAPNVSVGILSAVRRIWGKAIQTDAAVSPNNYGGALIDVRGRLLGVVVPLSPQSAEEVAGVEWYDSGIAFAVPADHVQNILPKLKKGEDLYPGVIGVSLPRDLYGGEPMVAAVQPGSPAAEAGLKAGDRIVEIDGRPIRRGAEIKEEISRRYAGETIHVVLTRDKDRIEADVALVEKLQPYEHPYLGVLPMRDAVEGGGVAVRYVDPDGPAAATGLAPGDVILALGGKAVEDREAATRSLGEWKPGQEVEVKFRHGDAERTAKITLATLPDALPPEQLPPARGDRPAAEVEGEPPVVGVVPLSIPEWANEAIAYVPEGCNPAVPHGLVLWLHAPGGFDQQALLALWKPLCDKHDLILLAPKSEDPERWAPREAALMPRLVEEVRSKYAIDPARVVVHGFQGGGTLGWLVAFQQRETFRAVAAVDAPPMGQPPANDPLYRLAVYVARSDGADQAAAISRTVERLREMKIPVTLKQLGQEARYLGDEELAELVRWIDMLDRL